MHKTAKYNPTLGNLDDFIKNNSLLVHKVCRKYKKALVHCEYEDLYNEGMIGLIKAYERFNPEFNVLFSTYGVPMIEGEIKRFIRDRAKFQPKFPRTIKEAAQKFLKLKLDIDFVKIDYKKIAKYINVDEKQARDIIQYLRTIKSLDEVVFEKEGEDPITLTDRIEYKEDYSTIYVKEFMESLPKKWQSVLKLRMAGHTQSYIGKVHDITQVQVSRILRQIGERYEKFFCA